MKHLSGNADTHRSAKDQDMATKQKQSEEKGGISKVQLAIGAASLFLFIVGLKRTFRVEDHREPSAAPEAGKSNKEKPAPSARRKR